MLEREKVEELLAASQAEARGLRSEAARTQAALSSERNAGARAWRELESVRADLVHLRRKHESLGKEHRACTEHASALAAQHAHGKEANERLERERALLVTAACRQEAHWRAVCMSISPTAAKGTGARHEDADVAAAAAAASASGAAGACASSGAVPPPDALTEWTRLSRMLDRLGMDVAPLQCPPAGCVDHGASPSAPAPVATTPTRRYASPTPGAFDGSGVFLGMA